MTTFFDFFCAHTQDLSHLPYSSFLAALDDIAIQHPDVRKLADAAAAAALEERVAIAATTIPVTATATSSAERRPGSGSGSDPRSRPGTGSGTENRSKGPTGRDSPGATSATSDGCPLPVAGGHQSKAGSTPARGNIIEDDGAAAAAVSPRGGGRKGGAGATAVVAKATAAAAAANVDVMAAEGFRPDEQRLLVLLQNYVLAKSQAGKEVPVHVSHEPNRCTTSVQTIHILLLLLLCGAGDKAPRSGYPRFTTKRSARARDGAVRVESARPACFQQRRTK